jgi:Uri superfamily endonuclease
VQKITKSDSGTYLLEIRANNDFTINHKNFSDIIFRKGFYYYSGSAVKNLKSRISRHVQKEKKIHWHIDYLTTKITNKVERVFIFEGKQKQNECEVIFFLKSQMKLEFEIHKFGNSDCNSCNSHLLYSKKKISYNQLLSLYQSTVRLIPSTKLTFGL